MFSVTVRDHMMIAHSFRGEVFGPAQRLHGATYVVDATFRRSGARRRRHRGRHRPRRRGAARGARRADLPQPRRRARRSPGVNTTTEALAQVVADRLAERIHAGDLGADAATWTPSRSRCTSRTSRGRATSDRRDGRPRRPPRRHRRPGATQRRERLRPPGLRRAGRARLVGPRARRSRQLAVGSGRRADRPRRRPGPDPRRRARAARRAGRLRGARGGDPGGRPAPARRPAAHAAGARPRSRAGRANAPCSPASRRSSPPASWTRQWVLEHYVAAGRPGPRRRARAATRRALAPGHDIRRRAALRRCGRAGQGVRPAGRRPGPGHGPALAVHLRRLAGARPRLRRSPPGPGRRRGPRPPDRLHRSPDRARPRRGVRRSRPARAGVAGGDLRHGRHRGAGPRAPGRRDRASAGCPRRSAAEPTAPGPACWSRPATRPRSPPRCAAGSTTRRCGSRCGWRRASAGRR